LATTIFWFLFNISICIKEYINGNNYEDSNDSIALKAENSEVEPVANKLLKTMSYYLLKDTCDKEITLYILNTIVSILPMIGIDYLYNTILTKEFLNKIFIISNVVIIEVHYISLEIINELMSSEKKLVILLNNGLKKNFVKWLNNAEDDLELWKKYLSILTNISMLDDKLTVQFLKDKTVFFILYQKLEKSTASLITYEIVNTLYCIIFDNDLAYYFDFERVIRIICNKLLLENNANNINLYLWFIKKYLRTYLETYNESKQTNEYSGSLLNGSDIINNGYGVGINGCNDSDMKDKNLALFIRIKETIEDISMKLVGDKLLLLNNEILDLIGFCYPNMDLDMEY